MILYSLVSCKMALWKVGCHLDLSWISFFCCSLPLCLHRKLCVGSEKTVVSGKWIHSCGLSYLNLFLVEADFEKAKVCKSSGK